MTSAHALHFGGLRGHHFSTDPCLAGMTDPRAAKLRAALDPRVAGLREAFDRGGFGPRGHGRHAMGGGRGGRHRHGGGPFERPEGPGFGPGGPGGPPFGPWGGRGGFGGPGRRRRMRRGDVRAALLLLLEEQPTNGYGLMQEIEQRSNGVWRPSPGSVYPALSQLEDEGLVRVEGEGGRKAYALTDEGRAHVDEHREALGEPWAEAGQGVGEGRLELRGLLWQLGAAAMQVGAAGTDAQVDQARQVLTDARKALYRLLAEDEDPTAGDARTDDDPEPPAAA